MKKWTGVLLALLLVLVCTAALATGTHAVGTKSERLAGNVAANGADSNGTTYVDWLSPPESVTANTVNEKVYLTWNRVNNANFYKIYEKISGRWYRQDEISLTSIELRAVDGVHTYGVSSVYVAGTGEFYESSDVRVVTVSVLNGSDIPPAGADIRELYFSGYTDVNYPITVYDNTYLHIHTDSLTWVVSQNGTLLQPDMNTDFLLYTSLGNELYLKATKHLAGNAGQLVVGTYTYTLQQMDGAWYYKMGENRAYFRINMTYISGDAPSPGPGPDPGPTPGPGGVISINGGNYIVNGDEATYTGPTDWLMTEIKVPDVLTVSEQKVKVTSIASNACKNHPYLKKVTIGVNVKVIGKSAFNGCVKLKTVSGGKNVTTIKDYAFKNCKALTKITLNSRVKKIGKSAFYGCKKLKTIIINTTWLTLDNIGSKAFQDIYKKATITCPAGWKKEYKKILRKRGVSSSAIFK